jgi:hypothetical protein
MHLIARETFLKINSNGFWFCWVLCFASLIREWVREGYFERCLFDYLDILESYFYDLLASECRHTEQFCIQVLLF